MELREYVRIITRSWWIIVPLTLASISIAVFFSYTQIPIYETSSRHIAKLAADLNNNTANAAYLYGVLAGDDRTFETDCQVLTGGTVKQRAYQLVGVDPNQVDMSDYDVTCSVLPTSSLLLLVVQGPSPDMAGRLNEAIGIAGAEVITRQTPYFPVEQVDPVFINYEPISPNHKQAGLLGGVLGFAMGVTIALLIEYLRSPLQRLEALSIRNSVLGVYNERYFQQRLSEEISRSRIRHRPISLAVLHLVPDEDFALLPEAIQTALLRNAALRMEDGMGEGTLIAALGKNLFGILLPETPGDEARDILTRLHNDIRTNTFQVEGYVSNFVANTGLVESSGGTLGPQAMVEKAKEALEETEHVGQNTIQLVRASPRPFVLGPEQLADMNGLSPALTPSAAMAGNAAFNGSLLSDGSAGGAPVTMTVDDNRPITEKRPPTEMKSTTDKMSEVK